MVIRPGSDQGNRKGETVTAQTSPQAAAIRGDQMNGSKVIPFNGLDRYRAMYRAAFNYHEKELSRLERLNKEISIDAAAAYWTAAAQDIESTAESFGRDPFIMDILAAIYSDLERTFKARRSDSPRD